ncbi:integrase core domain-containing protein [Patescibacteria group bacterium]|nr:integrase core domain-containing protein [Patescibacteria group bacterium]
MQNITKITLSWELYETGIPKTHIASRLEVNRDTIRLWIKGIERLGLLGFLDSYIQAKKGQRVKRQVNPILKRWIWEIREREMDCCGQKIQYFLDKEHGVKPAISKIYEILAEKYVIKSKWKKNQKRGPVPKALNAREVIQMDSIDFGQVFAFTGIDIYSKEADVMLRPSLTAKDGVIFLDTCMTRRFNGHSDLIQADGGSEFKDEFKRKVYQYTDRFRVASPYKKNEQSYIESFNRTVRKECLGWAKYRGSQIPQLTLVVNQFLNRYHYHRPHISLGMKPPLERS